jgi:hypothetical protein
MIEVALTRTDEVFGTRRVRDTTRGAVGHIDNWTITI